MASQIRSDSQDRIGYAHPTSIDFSFKEFSYISLPKVRLLISNVSGKGNLLKVSMIAWTIKCRKVRFEQSIILPRYMSAKHWPTATILEVQFALQYYTIQLRYTTSHKTDVFWPYWCCSLRPFFLTACFVFHRSKMNRLYNLLKFNLIRSPC